MVIERDKPFRVSGDVLFQEVGGETVLLDLNSENYFGLDEVGTRIWTLVNEGRNAAEMVDLLLEEYEVDPETLDGDVKHLLKALVEAGLLEQ